MSVHTSDPDQQILDEVATQLALNVVTVQIVERLAELDTSGRSWVISQLADHYCLLCGRPREMLEGGRLRMCRHGDQS